MTIPHRHQVEYSAQPNPHRGKAQARRRIAPPDSFVKRQVWVTVRKTLRRCGLKQAPAHIPIQSEWIPLLRLWLYQNHGIEYIEIHPGQTVGSLVELAVLVIQTARTGS